MMMNLFSIFDPSTSMMMSMNWLSLSLCILMLPLYFWLAPSRYLVLMKKMMKFILSEFKPLSKKYPQIINMILAFFLIILMNNLPGLLPYIFTATAHMTVSLSLALTMWVGLMMYACSFNTTNLLVHLIPNGTPAVLMPFMVLVETISNLIRPLTLAIRLTANMIAGHLLVTLLTSVTPLAPLVFYPLILLAQIMLASLEIAVAMIQAYVFSVLMTLYNAESLQ